MTLKGPIPQTFLYRFKIFEDGHNIQSSPNYPRFSIILINYSSVSYGTLQLVKCKSAVSYMS